LDAAASAGLDLSRLILIRPPAGSPRTILDVAAVLLRSDAFDVILCPLPAAASISTSFANKLATLAAKSGTTLLLLGGPTARGLGAAAQFRVRSLGRRWLWDHGELAGMRLRLTTERARAAGGADLASPQDSTEHHLTLRLHRRVRHGGSSDRLHLASALRVASRQPPGSPANRDDDRDDQWAPRTTPTQIAVAIAAGG
jgi:hypothetical protein